MRFRDDDWPKRGRRFVLVHGALPRFELVGWTLGVRGMRQQWRHEQGTAFAFAEGRSPKILVEPLWLMPDRFVWPIATLLDAPDRDVERESAQMRVAHEEGQHRVVADPACAVCAA